MLGPNGVKQSHLLAGPRAKPAPLPAGSPREARALLVCPSTLNWEEGVPGSTRMG